MKTKLLITFIAISEIANAQGSWTQKSNFGGTGRAGSVGFSIGTKGYIGTGTEGGGSSGPNKIDFWEWDQLNDTWIQKASFGGTARYCAVGFSINTKGYIGTGYDDNNGSTKKDFWEWDQASDTWTQKANLGGSVRGEAIGFSIGSKGYIGTGNDSSSLLKKDIWEWDQTSNVWSQKANFGGTSRSQSIGFSIGAKGYIGTGGNATKDFWEFDPTVTGINEVNLDNLISVYPNPASDFATISIDNVNN